MKSKLSTHELNLLKTLRPSIEDQRKLHAEINQLANQAILLNVAAIAFFGALASTMLSRAAEINSPFAKFIPLIGMVGLLILFVLFYMGFTYFRTIRFIASYLIYTKTSIWEQHYAEYYGEYGRPHFLYSESRAVLFLTLGTLCFAMPWVLRPDSAHPLSSMPHAVPFTVIFILYMSGVAALGFLSNLHLSQKANQTHWHKFFGGIEFRNQIEQSNKSTPDMKKDA